MRIRPILLSLLLTAAAAPAFAAGPAKAPETARETREATAAGADRDTDRIDRHCLRDTGTRIRLREGERRCTAFAGRVWTRDDLDRTGQTDIGDALRMLDVSIR